MSSGANKWLTENEWPDLPVDSDAFSHYTTMSTLMDQFAKEYHENELIKYAIIQKSKYKKFL